MIRPEKITLLAPTAPAAVHPGMNRVAATVREVVFMGEMTRCVVQLGGNGPLIVAKLQNRAGAAMVTPMAEMVVEFAIADARLISASS